MTPHVVTLAATDPANPYGALLPWPEWRAPAGEHDALRAPDLRAAARPARAWSSSMAASPPGSHAAIA